MYKSGGGKLAKSKAFALRGGLEGPKNREEREICRILEEFDVRLEFKFQIDNIRRCSNSFYYKYYHIIFILFYLIYYPAIQNSIPNSYYTLRVSLRVLLSL